MDDRPDTRPPPPPQQQTSTNNLNGDNHTQDNSSTSLCRATVARSRNTQEETHPQQPNSNGAEQDSPNPQEQPFRRARVDSRAQLLLAAAAAANARVNNLIFNLTEKHFIKDCF